MTERRTLSVETARAAVLASGELESLDGPYFLASEDAEWKRMHFGTTPPIAARVNITRRGQAERPVIIGWDEYEAQDQTDPDWNATRALKPMTIFGAEVERHAYRVTFADILAPLLTATPSPAEDEHAPRKSVDAAPSRNWLAEFALARTVEAVTEVHAECRAAKAYTTSNNLDVARRNRVRQLENPDREFTGLAAEIVREMDRIRAEADTAWAPAPGSADAEDIARASTPPSSGRTPGAAWRSRALTSSTGRHLDALRRTTCRRTAPPVAPRSVRGTAVDADPTTGTVVAVPDGFDAVPLNVAVLDEDWLLQWTPTRAQIVGALSIARAKNLAAPGALDGYRRKLSDAKREQKVAIGLAVQRLRIEHGHRATRTELVDLAHAVDERVIAADDAVDTAWLLFEYAKDFANAIERDVSLIQSIAKAQTGGQP